MITFSRFEKLGLFFLTVFLLVFLGCEERDYEIIPLESKVLYSIQEGYDEPYTISEPRIMLSMVTEKIYPCFNWSIACEVYLIEDLILIEIIGIYVPEICFFAFGPATYNSFLDISNGEYLLYFTYKGIVDKYILTITDSSIAITEDTLHFTQPNFTLFWRYPPNSFAYLCGTTIGAEWICEDFLDTLLSEVELEEFQFPDSGEISYPCSSMGHYYDMPAKYFFYQEEEDYDTAGEILEVYTHDVISHYSGVGISLINWRNKSYKSWLF